MRYGRRRKNRQSSQTRYARAQRGQRKLWIETLESRAMLSASGSPDVGILLLDQSSAGSLTNFGSGGVHVTGGGAIVIDSKSLSAGINYGMGSVSAAQIDVTGRLKSYGHGRFQGTTVNQSPMADPLAATAMPFDTGIDNHSVSVKKGSLTLLPGTYDGGIHISGNAQVTLLPGTYYLAGGGLSISGNGKLTGSGVTIYNAPNNKNDRIYISGNGTVTLSAPTSGDYASMVLCQSANSSAQVVFAGGTVNLTGQVYAPKATLYLLGSHNLNIGGSAALGITGGLVVDKLYTSGNGRVNVDATPYQLTDLSITMGDTGDATLIPGYLGSWLEYYVTVTNNGSTTVSGAKVSDVFPSSFEDYGFRAFPSDGAQSQLVYPYEFGDGFTGSSLEDTVTMAPGSSIEYEITGDAGPDGTGMFVNTATVTPPAFFIDTNPADNTVTDSHPLSREADVGVSIGDGIPAASPGNTVVYTINAVLAGPSAYQHAVLSDTVPSNVASFTVTGPNGFTAQGHGGDTFSDSSLGFTGGQYGQQVYYTLTEVISPTASGTLNNTVSITPPDGVADIYPDDNSATDSDIIAPPADLAVSVNSNVTSAVAGTGVTYTVTVTNNGPTDVTGAEVVDQFPPGMFGPLMVSTTPINSGGGSILLGGGTFNLNPPSGATSSSTGGEIIENGQVLGGAPPTSSTSNNGGTGTIVLNGGTLILGSTGGVIWPVLTYPFTVNSGSMTNSAAATGNAAVVSPAAANATTASNTTLGLTTTSSSTFSGSTTISSGTLITGVINTNGGNFVYDAGIISDSYTAVGTGGATGFSAAGSGNIDDFVNLPAGASIVYTVTANIGPYGGDVTDTATVTAPTTVADINLGNNTATETIPLSAVTNVSITQTDDATTAVAGVPTTYTIVVSNTGPSTAEDKAVDDIFPASIDSDTYTADFTGGASLFGFPGESTNIVNGTGRGSGNINDLATLPPGATITYHVTAQVDLNAVGNLVNTATINDRFSTSDNDLSTSTSTRSIVDPNDLRVTVSTADASGIAGGDPVTYTVTVTNTGTQDASGAKIVNTVYAGGSYTINGNLIIQRGGSSSDQYIASGTAGTSGFTTSGTGDIDDTVTIPAGGSITYTVTATGPVTVGGGQTNLGDAAAVTPPSNFNDMVSSDNLAHDEIPFIQESDLSVVATDNVGGSSVTGATGTIPAQGTVVYTLVVTNNGPGVVTAVSLSANVYWGSFTYQMLDAQGNPTSAPLLGYQGYGNEIDGTLAPGESETIVITATAYPWSSGQQMVTEFSVGGGGVEVSEANNFADITDNISAS